MISLERVLELCNIGLFALAGGVAKQCQVLLKGDEIFSLVRFSLHIGLAVFTGITVGSFIPADVAYRDGVMLMIGFTAQPLLEIMEVKFLKKAGAIDT